MDDKRIKRLAIDIFLYSAVFIFSSYATFQLIEYFVNPEAKQLTTDKQFTRKLKLGTAVNGGFYKNPDQISSELHNLQEITSDNLKNPYLFTKGKTFFLQVVPDTDQFSETVPPQEDMHPHYYWIRKTLRKESKPLFAYKIETSKMRDNKGKRMIKEVFKIDSLEELNNTHYILVNSDGLKLPVGGRVDGSSIPGSIPIKFV